jgi:hypothetical protein
VERWAQEEEEEEEVQAERPAKVEQQVVVFERKGVDDVGFGRLRWWGNEEVIVVVKEESHRHCCYREGPRRRCQYRAV